MSGNCTSIPSLLVAGLMIVSMQARPADAAPTWLALISLPVHGNGVQFGGAGTPIPRERPADIAASEISKEELCDTLVSSARERQLPVSFFTNLIWQESRFDARSVSHAGAEGIAQFMPTVSKEVGLANPFDPRQAIPAAAQLLRTLMNKFGNLGPGGGRLQCRPPPGAGMDRQEGQAAVRDPRLCRHHHRTPCRHLAWPQGGGRRRRGAVRRAVPSRREFCGGEQVRAGAGGGPDRATGPATGQIAGAGARAARTHGASRRHAPPARWAGARRPRAPPLSRRRERAQKKG